MSKAFVAKKSKILASLAVPDAEYTDLSPKGAVDVPVRDLVAQINAIPELVTTSSCSGRIVVYSEGRSVRTNDSNSGNNGTNDGDDSTTKDSSTTRATQGKGGGRWLFVSHSPVNLQDTAVRNDTSPSSSQFLLDLLAHPSNEAHGSDKSAARPPIQLSNNGQVAFAATDALVHLKFEPLILHVMAASTSSARKLLIAAQAAGFRESGIASIPAILSTPTKIGVAPQSPRLSESDDLHKTSEFASDETSSSLINDPGVNADSRTKYPKRVRKPQKANTAADSGPVMVAIRTTGLAFDAPIAHVVEPPVHNGCQDDHEAVSFPVGDSSSIRLVVSDAYLISLVDLGNARFKINEERKVRLADGLAKAFG